VVNRGGYSSESRGVRCLVNRGATPRNHKAQVGVSRGQWLISLAMKPQWAYTIWGIGY
jgi:hypothetical protein